MLCQNITLSSLLVLTVFDKSFLFCFCLYIIFFIHLSLSLLHRSSDNDRCTDILFCISLLYYNSEISGLVCYRWIQFTVIMIKRMHLSRIPILQ